jgi:hypothetical protein
MATVYDRKKKNGRTGGVVMDGVLVEKERRQDIRLDFSGRLFFQITATGNHWFLPKEEQFQREGVPSARIVNAGSRGCCLVIDRPLEKYQILKMNIHLAQENFTIPTLAEVCWMRLEPHSEEYQYRVGVRYLL